MSYRNLLTDRCDIYHLTKESQKERFGVNIDDEYTYSEEPDLINVPCYFTKTGQRTFITQAEPNTVVSETMLIHFLPSVDVRVNDKVIFNDIEYKLSVPRKIKNHHIEVEAMRVESL